MNNFKKSDIAVLILAAGGATRMGRPKQLLIWRGKTLLHHSMRQTQQLTNKFIVVLGAYNEQISPLIPNDNFTVNPEWKKGMGSSIAHGVLQLEQRYLPQKILIQLADQPLLQEEHFKKLVEKSMSHPNEIICTAYGDKPGVPAVFPKAHFESLKKLDAGFGARKFLSTMKKEVILVEPIGQLRDLDTPEDYDSLLAMDSDE